MLGHVVDSTAVPRERASFVAGERQMLEAWLDFHRQTLLGKCS